MLQGLVVIRHC